LRKKRKYEGTEKFAEKMKNVQEEAKAVLQKAQEDMKQYADRDRKEIEKYKCHESLNFLEVNISFNYIITLDQ